METLNGTKVNCFLHTFQFIIVFVFIRRNFFGFFVHSTLTLFRTSCIACNIFLTNQVVQPSRVSFVCSFRLRIERVKFITRLTKGI